MRKKNENPPVLISGMLLVVLVILVFALGGKQLKENKEQSETTETKETFSDEKTFPENQGITAGIPSFTVTVQSTMYTGQGVVYACSNDTYYIVTTAHLMEGTENGQSCNVTFNDGTTEEGVLIHCSEVADVAFVMLQTDRDLEPVCKDRARFDSLVKGDVITAYSIENHTLVQTQGTILSTWIYLEDFSLDMMLVEMEGHAGMSGGAILDEEGFFVGILCGVSTSGEAAVLPYSVVESEMVATGRETDS